VSQKEIFYSKITFQTKWLQLLLPLPLEWLQLLLPLTNSTRAAVVPLSTPQQINTDTLY